MDEPLTKELLDELLSAPDPGAYLSAHRTRSRGLAEYLQQLLEEKGLRRADVVRTAGVGETYGWQLFTGKRQRPSRDIVLQLAFAMRMTLQETDRALQAAGCSNLYCKNRRDAIIIFCIDHGATLQRANETLYEFGEDTVGGAN